jgi:hypothetical protein
MGKRRPIMAKVFGIHEIELRPGVTAEEFEQFMADAMPKWPQFEGFTAYVAKGDRGAHAGKYILVFEIESTEARDRYYPAPDMPSEEAQRASEGSAALFEKLDSLCSSTFTDYVVIAK